MDKTTMVGATAIGTAMVAGVAEMVTYKHISQSEWASWAILLSPGLIGLALATMAKGTASDVGAGMAIGSLAVTGWTAASWATGQVARPAVEPATPLKQLYPPENWRGFAHRWEKTPYMI